MGNKKSKPCLHEIFGIPKNWKRHWEAYSIRDKDGKFTDYTCNCKASKEWARKNTSLSRAITVRDILTDEEWNLSFRYCRFCGKELVPNKERKIFVNCPFCNKKVYL